MSDSTPAPDRLGAFHFEYTYDLQRSVDRYQVTNDELVGTLLATAVRLHGQTHGTQPVDERRFSVLVAEMFECLRSER